MSPSGDPVLGSFCIVGSGLSSLPPYPGALSFVVSCVFLSEPARASREELLQIPLDSPCVLYLVQSSVSFLPSPPGPSSSYCSYFYLVFLIPNRKVGSPGLICCYWEQIVMFSVSKYMCVVVFYHCYVHIVLYVVFYH